MADPTTPPSAARADGPRLTLDEAIQWMRTEPALADVVRDTYLDENLEGAAARFASSAEFAAARALVGESLTGQRVLDLGAGTGIAARAWIAAGAAEVVAVEPDPSELVGRGALLRLCAGWPVEVCASGAEQLDVPSASVDVVYVRQALHHLRDLEQGLRECARVLRPGGRFLACREHVVDDEAQLRAFLAAHPVHQLAGGEHAFPAGRYRRAIAAAGLELVRELGPWDSVINAFPLAHSDEELATYPRRWLIRKFGPAGGALARMPGIAPLVWRWLRRPRPGRMHTFLAGKPARG